MMKHVESVATYFSYEFPMSRLSLSNRCAKISMKALLIFSQVSSELSQITKIETKEKPRVGK
jgi:hypothetical protein